MLDQEMIPIAEDIRAELNDFVNINFKPKAREFIENGSLKKPSNADLKCIRRFVDGFDVICETKLNMERSDLVVLVTSQLLEPTTNHDETTTNHEILLICSSREVREAYTRKYTDLNLNSRIKIFDKANIEEGDLNTGEITLDHVKYLILDEFDKISGPPAIRSALVRNIFKKTQGIKQVMMFFNSDVLSEEERNYYKKFLKHPIFVENESKLSSQDLRHYYIKTSEDEKDHKILDLLEVVSTAVIFVNSDPDDYQDYLSSQPTYDQIKERILITTHLNAMKLGQRVKMIINYDSPKDVDEYIDRVNCVAMNRSKIITFVSNGNDDPGLEDIKTRSDIKMTEVSAVSEFISWHDRVHWPSPSRGMVQVLYQKIKNIKKK